MRYKKKFYLPLFLHHLPHLKFPLETKLKMVTLSSSLPTSPTLCSTHLILFNFPQAGRALSHFRSFIYATYFLNWNSPPFLYLENFHFSQVSGNMIRVYGQLKISENLGRQINYIFRPFKFGQDLKSRNLKKCLVYSTCSRNIN